jgi:hypothetical protein
MYRRRTTGLKDLAQGARWSLTFHLADYRPLTWRCRERSDKYYLYVEHSKDQGISIVDISKPAQPKEVGVLPWPDPALSGRMSLTGTVAIIAESEHVPMHSVTATDDLVFWDLSNPAAPRVVQEFSGVVKWLQDERNFIYVLNGDGLWVVSEPADRQPELTGPPLPYGD